MNIGLMVDFNYLLNMEEYKTSDSVSSLDVSGGDSVSFHGAGNVAFGIRAGAEIMAGKHVGFNLDFLFQYSYFETEQSEYDSPDGTYYNKWFLSYLMPMFGIGLGVNFYF